MARGASAIDAYERSALAAAEAALKTGEQRAALVGCAPASTDDPACLEQLVRRVGRRLYRRPLLDEEVTPLVALGQTAARGYGDFYRGAQWVLVAMLQSPQFLYVDLPDPAAPSGYALASRLAFFVWGSTPDDALLDAAERGELDTAAGVSTQVDRLLDDPRARSTLRQFFDEVYRLRELETLPKDVFTYPQFKPPLAMAMREETQRDLADLIWEQDGDFRSSSPAGAPSSTPPSPSTTGCPRWSPHRGS